MWSCPATGIESRALPTNIAGSVTTTAATLTVSALAPTVSTQPTDQATTSGATALFTAAGAGDPAPSVQWQVSTDEIGSAAGSGGGDLPRCRTPRNQHGHG